MSDYSQVLSLDVSKTIAGLSSAADAAERLNAEIAQTAAVATGQYQQAAQAAVNYANSLGAARAEQRGAADAVRSASEALRELNQRQRELQTAQGAVSSTTAEYQRLGKELDRNAGKIREVRAAIQENKAAVEQERQAVAAATEAWQQEANAAKLVAAAAKDAAAAAKQEATAQKEAAGAAQQTGEASGGLLGVLGKFGGLLGGLFIAGKIKQIGQEVIETTSEFQRLQAVLTTINNGDQGKAQREFAGLRQFALSNPFEVKDITEAYVQLRNRGIAPTMKQLQSLGDLAAASGQDIGRVSEALLGATTGQFRMLKAFGVTAQQQGDNVAFTFHGVTTVVQKSQEAIADYVLKLGTLNGVAGSTARIMETTGGRITNLKDQFTELFNTIGEGSGGPINAFIRGLTLITRKTNEFFKSDKQKVQDAASGPITEYEQYLDKQYQVAAARAKLNGQAAYYAVYQVAQSQEATVKAQIQDAERDLEKLRTIDKGPRNTADRAQLVTRVTGRVVRDPDGLELLEAEKQATQEQKAQLLIGQQSLAAIRERAKAAITGTRGEVSELGLLATARAKLAADEKTREENKDIGKKHELNQLIIADQKVIDDLLEKQEKKRKESSGKLEAALRALYAERETLRSLAAKAAAKDADEGAVRARLAFSEALAQVDVLKQKLVEKELAVRKAGGTGANADGKIDGTQEKALAQLRVAALDAYYAELAKITAAREERLFTLRADSDAKELDAINRKYDKELAAQHLGQSAAADAFDEATGVRVAQVRQRSQEELAIEEARQRDLLRLRQQQAQKGIDSTAAGASAAVTAQGSIYGEGTGISVINAKRAEKKALLEIEQKAAEDTLNNSLLLGQKEGQLLRAQTEAKLADIRRGLKEVEDEKKNHRVEDFVYSLVLGDKDSPQARQELDQAVGNTIGALAQLTQATIDASGQRVAARTAEINDLQTQLTQEIQYQRAGSASNIAGKRQEIAELKKQRQQALEDQRAAQKTQILLDTALQASSLITAVAQTYAGFAAIPVIGPILGIAAGALLVGAFIGAKVKAYDAVGKGAGTSGSGYYEGGYTGGTGSAREERGPVHAREFVFDHEKTAQFRSPLFEPLHTGRPDLINWQDPALRALLPTPFAHPNPELPAQLGAITAARHAVAHHHTFGHLSNEMGRLSGEMAGIRAHVARIPKEQIYTDEAGNLVREDAVTGSKVTYVKVS